MKKELQNKGNGLGFLRHWKVMTMTLLLLTFSIGNVWGACDPGTIFKFEVKNSISGTIPNGNSVDLSSYVTTTAGSVTAYVNSGKLTIDNGKYLKITDKSKAYFICALSEGCTLQAGDVIRYSISSYNALLQPATNSGDDDKLALSKPSSAYTLQTTTIPVGHALIGESTFYIFAASNNGLYKSIEIIRPATINLDATENGGTAVDAVKGVAGDKVVLPHAFKKDNEPLKYYKFKGWYAAPSGGSPVANYYEVTGDETLYAQFEDNPTSGVMFSLAMQSSMKPSTEVTVKSGAGYVTELDLLQYALISGGAAKLKNSSTNNHAKVTTNGKISLAGSNGNIQIDLDFPLQAGDEIATDVSAKTWVTHSSTNPGDGPYVDGTNTSYIVKSTDTDLIGATTLYLWRSSNATLSTITITRPVPASTYTVTLNPAGGSITPVPDGWSLTDGKYIKADVEDGSSVDLLALTKSGYLLDGWQDGENADYTSPVTIDGADLTLTAQWASAHTVSFAANGGGSSMSPEVVKDGTTYTIPACGFTPEDAYHAFSSWAIAGVAGKTTGMPDETFTMPAGDVTLTAQWSASYTVAEGTHTNGSITFDPTSAAAGTQITLTATPDEDYLFSAWDVCKTGETSTKVTVTNNKFNMPEYGVTVNATFVADPRAKVLYLTTNSADATKTNDKLYAALKDAYNVKIQAPASQTLTDYALVVLHESIGGTSDAAAVTGCKTTSVPVLNTKSYFYGADNDASKRWTWGAPNAGTSVNGATQNSAYCNITAHPLFNGVTVSDGFFGITDDAANKCMQPIGSFATGYEGYTLAMTPNAATPGGNGCAIHEIPAGTTARGALSGKYLMISVSNAKLNDLNANGQKLFQNAAAYLIGSTAWSPATAPTSPAIVATGGAIHAVGDAVTMTASASNVSATTLYAWYKGETLADAEEAGAIQTAKTAAAGGTTYSIGSCELASAGTYWCVVINAEGCEASASLELSVSSTPITTYDITYVSAKGTAPDPDNAASVTLAEITGVSGWEHQGWKADVDVVVDDATVTANTLIANGKTAVLSADVTFTAVWRQVLTVTYNANGGTCGTASATWGEGDAALVLPDVTPVANLVFDGWYTEATGGTLIGRAGGSYTPTADIEIFAHFGAKLYQAVYANGFDAFINQSTKTVTVYYLDGTPAPALTSVKAMKADGSEVAAGTFVDNGSTIDVTIDEKTATYTVNKTAVTPYTYVSDDAVVFGGTETYVKTGNSFSTDASKLGWKFSKNDIDWSRELPGNNRIYFFIGAAESVTFTTGCTSDRSAKFYRNGELIKTETIAKNTGAVTVAGSNAPAMYAVVSNQTSGDGSIKSMTLAPWVPVTAVALKEGEDPISSKEIYATASFTLTAEVTPDNASNKTITWTSSNDAIATVADGVVTGVAANASPVTITASTVDGVTATCAVTVTAAPEPSADPVITAQPASANYYEGATIAALEVVATGESLSYQWYLGSDAISGAESATYTPTVSAIGSYVYHCVVTNTEAGKLPTSLASSNATITIAEDPSAIKLINKSTGAINTTNFITGVTANNNVHGENGAIFGSSSSNASVKGLSGLNKVVVYNATTTQTKIKLVLYNTNSAAQEVVLSTMAEGDVDPVGQAISVPSKELYSTGYITYNSTKNRTFYLHTKSTNVQISQIQVIESGDELAVAGKKDYSLNLNKGRVYAYASTAQTWEGLSMNLGSNYSPATTEYITFKDNALSFSVPNDVCLTITPARAGDKYYVTDVADGTDNATTTVAGTPNSFDLTGGVGKVWYIRSQGSNVQLTNIAFSAPKCAEPAFNSLANSDICSGDPYVALNGTATVADAGVPTYQWYREDNSAIDGETNATYTPSADGKYYVIAVNHLAGFSDNEKKSDLVTVTTYASAAITTAPTDVRQTVGEEATLSVVATGKAPLSYQWYTCDENGDNTVIITGAEEDSYSVTVTDGLDQYYKVVVSSGCGEASAIARIVEWVALPQLSVSATTTWDWVNAGENIKLTSGTTPAKNEECVMANVKVSGKMPRNDATFNSQALLFCGENVRAVDGGRAYASVAYIKFNTTVSGKVTVEFSTNTDDKVRCVKINGVASETSDKKTTVKTFSTVVPAGEVSLVGYEGETENQYIRISKIIFSTTDVDGADYTRDVTEGRYGTICLPKEGVMVGASIFELAYYSAGENKIFMDQVVSGEMVAGRPYVFLPYEGADKLGVYYTDDEAVAAGNYRGLYGYFDGTDNSMQLEPGDGHYILHNNLFREVTDSYVWIDQNRAYFKIGVEGGIPTNAVAPLPGRRRMAIGAAAPQAPTGLENGELINGENGVQKVLINGELFILRGEKMYDATGRLVK